MPFLIELDPEQQLVALRVLCGVWFWPHIIGKLRNLGPAAGTFEKAGFRPAPLFVRITIFMEVLASLSLITGVLATLGAIVAAAVLIGAAYAVVRINGFNWRWQKQGPEYMILWAVLCLVSAY